MVPVSGRVVGSGVSLPHRGGRGRTAVRRSLRAGSWGGAHRRGPRDVRADPSADGRGRRDAGPLGGALGLLLGGAGELLYHGDTTANVTPYTGMGYGTAIGLVAAGALAT